MPVPKQLSPHPPSILFAGHWSHTNPLRCSLTFAATSKAQAEAWQRKLRAKLIELLGGFPSDRTPLEPQIIETRLFPSYRRDKFIFTQPAGRCRLRLLTHARKQ